MAYAPLTSDFLYFPTPATRENPEITAYPGIVRLPNGRFLHHRPDYRESDPPLLIYLHEGFQSFYSERILHQDSLDPLVPFLDGLVDVFLYHRDSVDTLTDSLDTLEGRSAPLLANLADTVRDASRPRQRLAHSLRRIATHMPVVPPDLSDVTSTAAGPAAVSEAQGQTEDTREPVVHSLPSPLFPSRPPTPITYADSSSPTSALPQRLRDAIVSYLQAEDIDVNGEHVLALFLRTPATPYPFERHPRNMLRNAPPPLNHLLPCLTVLESVLDAQRRHLELARRRILRLEGYIMQSMEDAMDELVAGAAEQAGLESVASRLATLLERNDVSM